MGGRTLLSYPTRRQATAPAEGGAKLKVCRAVPWRQTGAAGFKASGPGARVRRASASNLAVTSYLDLPEERRPFKPGRR